MSQYLNAHRVDNFMRQVFVQIGFYDLQGTTHDHVCHQS